MLVVQHGHWSLLLPQSTPHTGAEGSRRPGCLPNHKSQYDLFLSASHQECPWQRQSLLP